MLGIEAAILLLPLTAAVCYAALFSATVGVPALVLEAFARTPGFNVLLAVAVIGNFAGLFAIGVLWSLVMHTLKEREYLFPTSFRCALVAGSIASICAGILFQWNGLVFGVFPPTILALHFSFLQRSRNKRSDAQPCVAADSHQRASPAGSCR